MPVTKRTPEESKAPYPAFAMSLEQHAKAEEKALEELEQLRMAEDPLVALIAGLVLQDERHHHALLKDLAKQTRPLSYLIRRATAADVLLPEEIAADFQLKVGALAAGESAGIASMQALAQQYLKPEDAAARAVLEWMIIDSGKHERMFRMLETHLKRMVQRAREERLHGKRRIEEENSFA